ncbi:Tri1p, partial [Ascoidea rubescens DSM 1968]
VFNVHEYLPTIDAILSVADLEKMTVKKLRNALQELFTVDLLPHKEEVNKTIMLRYFRLVEARKTEQQQHEQQHERQQQIQKNELLAAKLHSSLNANNKKLRSKVALKASDINDNESNTPGGLAKPVVLSAQLQLLLNCHDKLPRTAVVKKLWEYIKLNNLQNPSDKREIICDEAMQPIFGEKISMFQLSKVTSAHLF